MQQDNGQPLFKKRTKNNLSDQEPLPLPSPKAMGRAVSGPKTTEPHALDDKMGDPQRPHTSVIRYDTARGTQSAQPTHTTDRVSSVTAPVPARRQQRQGTRNLSGSQPQLQPRITTPPVEERKHVHWLLPLGIGMIAMLVLWMLGSSVLAWGIQRYNDVRYGYPRTYQTDVVVGHGGDSAEHPSHFIAMNLNRQAIVVEFMASDPAKSVSYVAPFYIDKPGGDLVPVTVEFRDVTGDNKVDMIMHIHLPSQDQIAVFVNDGTKFRPSNGNDKIRI